MKQWISGHRIFTGERLLMDHSIAIENGMISEVCSIDKVPIDAKVSFLPDEIMLAPGLIDLQINGAGGVLFNDTPTVEATKAIAATARNFGITGILPTFITDDFDKTFLAARAALEAARDPNSGVLGVHLEGPFLSMERRGTHHPDFLKKPTEIDLQRFIALGEEFKQANATLMMTLAPEETGIEFISTLARIGVIIALGHTAASFELCQQALTCGAVGFTHLGNAMPPVKNRDPGPVIAGLIDPRGFCTIIADGIHLHPAFLKMVLRLKSPESIVLVSDAMSPLGTDWTSFNLYGNRVKRHKGQLINEEGALTGADIDLLSFMTLDSIAVKVERGPICA